MFNDFSFPLSVYKRPPVNRTSLWPVHSGTLNAVQRRPGTHGPLWYFYTTLHIFPRLSQRQCYHCANSSTNVLSTLKMTCTYRCLLLFRFIPSFPDAHLALAFKLLRWAALQSEAEKSQLARLENTRRASKLFPSAGVLAERLWSDKGL